MSKSVKIRLISIIIIVFLIASVIFFALFMNSKIYNDSITIADMEIIGGDEMFCKIDVSFITGKIATRGEDSFYLAGDEENIYIIATKNPLPKELEDIKAYSYMVTDEKPKSYKIQGISYEIESDLKDIALKAYNDLFKNQKIDESDFYEYFGEYYLSIDEIYDRKEKIYLIIFAILGSIDIILLILMICIYKKK